MSKKMIAIMKKEFARFFGDKRLVFTTILMPGLMIYILYTLLGQGIMKQFAASEDYVYQIYIHGIIIILMKAQNSFLTRTTKRKLQ